jgi:hypothetical protein
MATMAANGKLIRSPWASPAGAASEAPNTAIANALGVVDHQGPLKSPQTLAGFSAVSGTVAAVGRSSEQVVARSDDPDGGGATSTDWRRHP